jgi:hypothetical protein
MQADTTSILKDPVPPCQATYVQLFAVVTAPARLRLVRLFPREASSNVMLMLMSPRHASKHSQHC